MTAAGRPGSHQRGGREEDRQRAVGELRERAAERVRALVTGEDWAAWLRLAARLPGWSFTNLMLIAGQRPGVTMVAGYKEWQARGRQVRKGEPGIQVITEPRPLPGRSGAPVSAANSGAASGAGDRVRATRRTYVWDVAQTDGIPGAGPELPLWHGGGPPPGLWDALTWLARREGFAVERTPCGPLDGMTNWGGRRTVIRSGLDGSEAAMALLHELGHVLAHDGLSLVTGTSSAGCRGGRKVEADSVAFTVATRLGMDTSAYSWPYVASWAGSDPRARPEETIRASGERVTFAAATIAAHLDVILFAAPSLEAVPASALTVDAARGYEAVPEPAATAHIPMATTGQAAEISKAADPDWPAADLGRVLLDAERFYVGHLKGSWVPGYLAARGLQPVAVAQWHVGYAPAGWTALTRYLRGLGHDDALIEAAGLARRSSRGTLIDHFRDRVMLAIRDEHGMIAGFIGRAHPEAGPAVPKYLNSPETSAYTKGDLLFGLHEARDRHARGAMPVVVEGPFDAIAVTAADPLRYAGLAPCGTALTGRQAIALGRAIDLGQMGVLVALDGDCAGREAAIKAYGVLLAVTDKTTAVILPAGLDPAGILQADGTTALSRVLQQRTEPLARVVIDAHLDTWASQIEHAEGRLNAMRSAASLIASLLPSEAAGQILQVTGGLYVATLGDDLRPLAAPELPVIARMLPADAACQIARVGDRLVSDYSDVMAEVANAIIREATAPKRPVAGGRRNDLNRRPLAWADTNPIRLAAAGFPESPCVASAGSGAAGNSRALVAEHCARMAVAASRPNL
jgi:DNA primase